MVSASADFLVRPMTNSTAPRERFSNVSAAGTGRANCGMISLWRVSGPAISCGKKVTNSKKSISPYCRRSPRLRSIRYEIFWKTKKLIPSGSTIGQGECIRPSSASTFPARKFAYLKTASTSRFSTNAERQDGASPAASVGVREQPVGQRQPDQQRQEAPGSTRRRRPATPRRAPAAAPAAGPPHA